MHINKQIKHVAIYLRKSREEDNNEDVLAKHRFALTEVANRNGWTYKEYYEVVSGESIAKRSEMQKLLTDVEAGHYDGVLVVAIDRLTRGRIKDLGVIEDAFLEHDTLILTPDRTYDFNDKNDYMMIGMLCVGSRFEYSTTTGRFKDGKIRGAKLGKWTNGKPPMPYYYDKNTRQILIDEIKRPLYRTIVKMYLVDDMNLNDIAVWLTNNKIPTPYNIKPDEEGKKGWHAITVQRLLLSEIHLGYIVFGKTRSKKGRVEVVPLDEVIKVKGSHEVLKSEDEHAHIVAKLAKNRILNPNARRSELPLSNLIYCKKCGSKMTFRVGHSKGRGQYWSTLCVHKYYNGKRCEQVGKILDDEFYNALYEKIVRVDTRVLESLEGRNSQFETNKTLIEVKTKELDKHRRALEKIHESYEEQLITKSVYIDRKTIRENKINELDTEIRSLQAMLIIEERPSTKAELLEKVEHFKQLWKIAATAEEKNKALRLLVEKIVYDRVDNIINLTIFYK